MNNNNQKKLYFLFNHFKNLINIEFNFQEKFSSKLKDYFTSNKQLGSKDRKLLTELIYNYLRFKISLKNSGFTNPAKIFYIIFNISKKVSDNLNTFTILDDELDEFLNENQISIDKNIKDFYQINENIQIDSFPSLYQTQINKFNPLLFYIFNTKPPITIRPISQKQDLSNLKNILISNEIKFEHTLINTIDIFTTKGLINFIPQNKFNYEVQDNGSVLVSKFIAELKPKTILDACAGSGGKSLCISSFDPNIKINMYDKIYSRLKEYHNRNIDSYSNITLLDKLNSNNEYELVLVDAPCSGSGTIRRNPDKKHSITDEKINKFSELQLSILNEYSNYVTKGGILVYVTCSFFDKENIEVINKFLEINPKFQPLAIESNTIDDYSIKISNFANILIPINYDGDVFFIATLRKNH